MYRYDSNASALGSEVLARQSTINKLEAEWVDSLPPEIDHSRQNPFTPIDSMAGGTYQFSPNKKIVTSGILDVPSIKKVISYDNTSNIQQTFTIINNKVVMIKKNSIINNTSEIKRSDTNPYISSQTKQSVQNPYDGYQSKKADGNPYTVMQTKQSIQNQYTSPQKGPTVNNPYTNPQSNNLFKRTNTIEKIRKVNSGPQSNSSIIQASQNPYGKQSTSTRQNTNGQQYSVNSSLVTQVRHNSSNMDNLKDPSRNVMDSRNFLQIDSEQSSRKSSHGYGVDNDDGISNRSDVVSGVIEPEEPKKEEGPKKVVVNNIQSNSGNYMSRLKPNTGNNINGLVRTISTDDAKINPYGKPANPQNNPYTSPANPQNNPQTSPANPQNNPYTNNQNASPANLQYNPYTSSATSYKNTYASPANPQNNTYGSPANPQNNTYASPTPFHKDLQTEAMNAFEAFSFEKNYKVKIQHMFQMMPVLFQRLNMPLPNLERLQSTKIKLADFSIGQYFDMVIELYKESHQMSQNSTPKADQYPNQTVYSKKTAVNYNYDQAPTNHNASYNFTQHQNVNNDYNTAQMGQPTKYYHNPTVYQQPILHQQNNTIMGTRR